MKLLKEEFKAESINVCRQFKSDEIKEGVNDVRN